MRCRPGRWLLGLPLAILPFLAAWWLNGESLTGLLESQTAAALKSVEGDWATLTLDGRDAIITGEATSQEAVAAATNAVAAIYGIRRVDSGQVKVVVPVVLPPPTIKSVITNNNRPEVRGTWPEGLAKTLALTLPERTYSLGKDPELTSDGKGNWMWFPAQPMTDGSYEISIEVTDGAKAVAKTEAPGKLVIDTVAPKGPSFTPVKSDSSPEKISGNWAEGDAVSLKLGLAGKDYVLGQDQAVSTQAGTWTLRIPPLAPGSYDLTIETVDEAGNAADLKAPAAVIVVPRAAPPTVAKYAGSNPRPTIAGTFDSANTTSLTVAIGGESFELRTDPDLTTDDKGNWQLAIKKALKDGYYDVVATATNSAGNAVKDGTVAEVVIDTEGPAAPTVNPSTALPITGTFAAGDTKGLQVTLAGKTYLLGRDGELTAGDSNWTLAPAAIVSPGVYDIVVEATDVLGNVTRDATKDELVIAAPESPPAPPTADKYAGNNPQPTITGSYDAAHTASLTVAIGGKTYKRGADRDLTTDGKGNWRLAIKAPLKDGYHDVVVTAANEAGDSVKDGTVAEAVIDTNGPTAPTINPTTTLPITGTFAGGDAKSLRVSLAGQTYMLGIDKELTTDGNNWILAPQAMLPPGIYDVVIETVDAFGNVSRDTSKDEVAIPALKPEMAAPTVNPSEQTVARPHVSGTWSEGVANSLEVTLAGKTYGLATDPELASASGVWMLAVPVPLRDGVYDIGVETTDDAGKMLTDSTTDELTVDAAGPQGPSVKLYAGDQSPQSISGTWAEGDAVSLAVTIAGKTAKLGSDSSLNSDGKGNWSLALPEALKPGSYDVQVITPDQRGRIAADQTRFEVLVKEAQPIEPPAPPSPPPPPPPPPKIDCNSEFVKTLILHPIQFGTDRQGVPPSTAKTIKALADIAAQCPDERLEIGGHTDSVGSEVYNQALSERRAVAVMKAMIREGMDPRRLNAIGYGETGPLATNETEEGKAVNRRIEIKIDN